MQPDSALPRFIPEQPLPPYSFVPGRFPHPISDRAGHHYGATPEPAAPLDPADWQANKTYLFGFDLFNHGFYWEAHEEWEGLWHACGRKGPVADFLKGLIKLAAAGVKARENTERGVRDHAERAMALFQKTAEHAEVFLGFRPLDLVRHCREILARPPLIVEETLPVRIVFDFVLLPRPTWR